MCDKAYRAGERARPGLGLDYLNHALETDNTLEHLLSKLGAEISFQITQDKVMYRELRTGLPPGKDHVIPEWALAGARDSSKAIYQQSGRVAGGKGTTSSDDEDPTKSARARRRAAAAKKAAAARLAAGTGGKGGKGGTPD